MSVYIICPFWTVRSPTCGIQSCGRFGQICSVVERYVVCHVLLANCFVRICSQYISIWSPRKVVFSSMSAEKVVKSTEVPDVSMGHGRWSILQICITHALPPPLPKTLLHSHGVDNHLNQLISSGTIFSITKQI